MPWYKYMRLKLNDFPNNVIEQYNLGTKVTKDDCVYLKVCKLMYGLSQERILAQQLLEKILNAKGHKQSALTPGFWTHTTHLISFTLCVKDFGVKRQGTSQAPHGSPSQIVHHLLWLGGKALPWNQTKLGLQNWEVLLSMLLYIKEALRHFTTPYPEATGSTAPPCEAELRSKGMRSEFLIPKKLSGQYMYACICPSQKIHRKGVLDMPVRTGRLLRQWMFTRHRWLPYWTGWWKMMWCCSCVVFFLPANWAKAAWTLEKN